MSLEFDIPPRLLKLVIGLWTTLIIAVVVYYQIHLFFDFDHNSLLTMSFIIGTVSGSVLVFYVHKFHLFLTHQKNQEIKVN